MDTEKKLQIVIDLLPLIPYVAAGITEAVELWNKMLATLQNGITPDEQAAQVKERDDVLQRIIDKTA